MKKIFILLCLLSAYSIIVADPTPKPGIKVVFKIGEKKFARNREMPIDKIEGIVADSIAKFLGREFPIFNFDANQDFKDKLALTLKIRGDDDSYFAVDLITTLSGQNVQPESQTLRKQMYEEGQYRPLVGVDSELIKSVIKKYRISFDRRDMLKLLSCRWITEGLVNARLDCSDKRWTLPYTFGELQVGSQTHFAVHQQHKTGRGSEPRMYLIKVINTPAESTPIECRAIVPQKFQDCIGDDLNELTHLKMPGDLVGIQGFEIKELSAFTQGLSPIKPTQSK